jgi:hypothetical protein
MLKKERHNPQFNRRTLGFGFKSGPQKMNRRFAEPKLSVNRLESFQARPITQASSLLLD